MIGTMDHGWLRELAAGAALDDLDDREHRELDAHLVGCESCRALRGDLSDVVADLAFAAPELRPPDALRLDVLAAIRESHGADAAAPAAALTPALALIPVSTTAPPRRVALWGSLGLAAVLGIVALGLGARTAELTQDVARARAAVVEAEQRVATQEAAMALITDPTHRTANLHADAAAPVVAAVAIFRPGTTESYLMATDLPPTPDGHVYQLWYADAEGVHALGTFHYDGDGPFIAPFGVDLGDSAAAMVTLEPEGGAQGEPGPQVIFGEF